MLVTGRLPLGHAETGMRVPRDNKEDRPSSRRYLVCTYLSIQRMAPEGGEGGNWISGRGGRCQAEGV